MVALPANAFGGDRSPAWIGKTNVKVVAKANATTEALQTVADKN
jgi:hypothetical protein